MARAVLSWRLRALLVANFGSTAAFIGFITFAGDQVFAITDRELDLGLLAVALFIPVFLLSPIGGTVADRFDRRAIYAASVFVQVVTVAGLFLIVRSGTDSVAPYFLSAAIYGTCRAFGAPASRSLPIDLATPETLPRIVALKALAFQSGIIVGPVVAGFAAAVSDELPFLLSAGILVAVLALIAVAPSSDVERLETAPGVTQAFRDAIDGMRYLRTNRIVLGAIGLDLFAVLLGGATALLPAIAEKRLGVGEVGLGWLRAADGIGAASVSLLLASITLNRRIGKVLLWSVAVFGLATIALGVTTNYAVAFGAIVVLSAADAVSVYIRSSLVPLATPEAMRGRVLALENVFIGGSNELGSLESGVAAQLLGLVWAVVTGGLGTIAIVVIWWRRFPALRDIDTFDDVRLPTHVP